MCCRNVTNTGQTFFPRMNINLKVAFSANLPLVISAARISPAMEVFIETLLASCDVITPSILPYLTVQFAFPWLLKKINNHAAQYLWGEKTFLDCLSLRLIMLSPLLLHTQANPPAIRASRSDGREDTETAGSRWSDSKRAAHGRLCSTGTGCNETTETIYIYIYMTIFSSMIWSKEHLEVQWKQEHLTICTKKFTKLLLWIVTKK